MSDDPKSDLIDAILSMDSYNRGYGSGINNLLVSGSIGNFVIRYANPQEQADWKSTGFYAVAYTNSVTQQTVISYRGTDFNGNPTSLSAWLNGQVLNDPNKGGSDLTNGYGIALGAAPDAPFNLATEQAKMAQA